MSRSKSHCLQAALVCPRCRSELSTESGTCSGCQLPFSREAERWIFLSRWQDEQLAQADASNALKERIKQRVPWLYPTLVETFSPVMPSVSVPREVRGLDPDAVILNVGSGTTVYGTQVINIDLAPYCTVDVVADVKHLPFRSECADFVINVAVLEHVEDPKQVVAEIFRVLKPGAKALIFVPWMQGIHASPFDFQRYAPSGLKVLFSDFEIERIQTAGPTSGFLWILQEWLAMVFSFGSMRLYRWLYALSHVLAPIKLLDLVLKHHPAAANISTGFWLRLRKPGQ